MQQSFNLPFQKAIENNTEASKRRESFVLARSNIYLRRE